MNEKWRKVSKSVVFCAGNEGCVEENRCRYGRGNDFRRGYVTVEELWGEGLE